MTYSYREDIGGNRIWLDEDGRFHREDGPAIIRGDGAEFWYRHGVVHRDYGPAITWPDGFEEFWHNGQIILGG